ncbi:MAG TPA: transcriptional regulator [Candidatus Binatia bacterium]|nr:transcriptional regulator [Candidatus Binatia bacterium]
MYFGPFHFDPVNQCLWRGKQRLFLRPKAFAVLSTLVEHAGQLVTRAELLDAVWPGIYVSDGVLRFCVRELRKALGDKPQIPQFIETVHKRGYRFIAGTRSQRLEVSSSSPQATSLVERAVHLGAGENYERVMQNLRQAADTALRRSAYHDAIDYLTQGLELLRTVPETPDRAQQELALQLALVHSLRATKSFAAPEVEKVYTRVRELWQQVGEPVHLFPVLWGLGAGHAVGAELQTARELGEQLLKLAQSVQDPALLLETHMLYGSILVWRGELISGRSTRCLATYGRAMVRSRTVSAERRANAPTVQGSRLKVRS